jgi:parvulin-like peptidyl-prolyl isomerase
MRLLFGCALVALSAPASAQTAPAAPPATEVAATVNGQPVTVAELDAALRANLPNVPLTAAQRARLRATLVNDLIDDALLRQLLAKNAPPVAPTELDAQMKALTARLTRENATLAAYLKQTGQTEAQLRAEWATQIQLDAYVKTQVTDEQLKAYHAAHRDHYDRVEVRISHIMVRIGRSAPAADRDAAKAVLQAVRAEVAAGKLDFAAAARKHSQCPTAKDGGDLGFVFRRGMPEDEPLAKAAFAMKVGELSEVLETDYGFHILTVTDRKPGTPAPLEKCRGEVLEDYTDDYRAGLVMKLRKDAQIKITLP